MQTQFMDEAARRQLREAQALGTAMEAISALDAESQSRVELQLLEWLARVKTEEINPRSAAQKSSYNCSKDPYEVQTELTSDE